VAVSNTTLIDVEASLGRSLTVPEIEQTNLWIEDAELQIRMRLGDLTLLDAEALAYVVREAVAARLRNPEGFSSETIDDYTYRLPTETRRVTILDEWWRMLDPTTGAGAFSARPYFEADSLDAALDWS
jgi:hypothetical protein